MGKKNYGSAYGMSFQRYRYILKQVYNHFGRKYTILIPNALDGQHILPSVRRGYNVVCYESNNILLNGGTIDSFNIIGLKEKIKYFKMEENVELKEENFYDKKVDKEYDFVFCYKSLHLEENKSIPKDRKMRKLLSSVKENGILSIYYHLAEKEWDYNNYPKEQYFRKFEMKKYFDDSWEILFAREKTNKINDEAHPYNNQKHSHLVGHILVRKKYKKRAYKYTYNISVIESYK